MQGFLNKYARDIVYLIIALVVVVYLQKAFESVIHTSSKTLMDSISAQTNANSRISGQIDEINLKDRAISDQLRSGESAIAVTERKIETLIVQPITNPDSANDYLKAFIKENE